MCDMTPWHVSAQGLSHVRKLPYLGNRPQDESEVAGHTVQQEEEPKQPHGDDKEERQPPPAMVSNRIQDDVPCLYNTPLSVDAAMSNRHMPSANMFVRQDCNSVSANTASGATPKHVMQQKEHGCTVL